VLGRYTSPRRRHKLLSSLGRAQTNVEKLLSAKALLLYAEAFLVPLEAIFYILLLIKAKKFLLIAENIKFCYSLYLSRRHG
jgi:hypothetical protein